MDTPRTADARTVTPQQLTWLRTEVADWQRSGLIEPAQATGILEHYREQGRAGVRISLGRVLLALGGAFVGIGLIWLVAANLDRLSPEVRFAAVLVLWLGFLVGGEALDVRRSSRAVVGALRLMAALAFGALVLQAAQSLQVPAYEPRLVGLWAAGALLHGYAVRALAPVAVGVATGLFWWIAQPMWTDASGLGLVLVLGSGAVLAAAMAVLHDARPEHLQDQAWLWRFLAAALALVTLFAAAVPDVGSDGVAWSGWLVLEVAAAAVAAVVALVVRRGPASLEVLGALAVVAVSALLAAWSTGTDVDSVDAADWAHAVVSVVAYVLLAVALVALGTVRDRPPLAWLAMAGLVVFTTFQSFAVFAPIVTGAWLFVVLGTVFLGTGFLFDRARRQLTHALDDTDPGAGR